MFFILGIAQIVSLFHGADKRVLISEDFQDFPGELIDLWPDHNIHPGDTKEDVGLRNLMLINCLPDDNPSCQERFSVGSSTQRVGIIRPPGVLGDAFEDFVVRFIEMSRTSDTDMEVTVSIRSDYEDHSFTKILRPAVVPIMLEVIDLALQTTSDDFTSSEVTVDDLAGLLRRMIRWHCHMSHTASDTALLTLPFDRIMAHPREAEKDIAEFLGLHHENQKDFEVKMEDLTETVFHRIDACTEFLRQLTTASPITRIKGALAHAIRDEFTSGRCHAKSVVADDTSIAQSRVTEIVCHFLDESWEVICAKYPKAHICTSSIERRSKRS